MNPYGNQNNNGYSPYGQQPQPQPQQQFMNNLPADMQSVVVANGFSPQKLNGSTHNSPQQQQPTSFDPSLIANLVAKRQMYGQPSPQQQQQQQQQQPFSPTSTGGGSPIIAMSPTSVQSPITNNLLPMQAAQQGIINLQQGQWNKQPQPSAQQQMQQQQQRMDEGQRQQLLMMQQQQQQLRKQQQFQQMQQQMQQMQQQQGPQEAAANTTVTMTGNGSASLSPSQDASSGRSTAGTPVDSEINTKRVEIILAMNIELFRLCIESQRTGVNLEQNLPAYQAKLQSNLTYLAMMADNSMVKAGDEYKSPTPPDLTPLPPPISDIGKRIHEILNTARGLFNSINSSNIMKSPTTTESPTTQQQQQQQFLRQQANAMRQQQQQQFLNSTTPRSSSSPNINPSTPTNIPTTTSTTSTASTNQQRLMNMDPQAMLRQAQQQQLRQQQMMMSSNGNKQVYNNSPDTTQQMSPNDVLNANMMLNQSNNIMNMYTSPTNITDTQEDPNNYSNVMMMMQRLQQQQQQHQQQQQ